MKIAFPLLTAVLLALGWEGIATATPQGKVGDIEIPKFRLRVTDKARWDFEEPPSKIDFTKIPALLTALKGNDDNARQEAAGMLGFTGANGKVAIPALVDMLRDPNPDNRAVAANALGNLGPVAKEAVPALVRALKDNNDVVHWMVLYALIHIGPDAREAIPTLLEVLNPFDGSCKSLGVSSLGALSALGPEAFPALIKQLHHPNATRRATAAWAVGTYYFQRDPQIKQAVSPLLDAAKDADPKLRAAAVHALGEIRLDAEKAIPVLMRALEDPDKDIPWRAAIALGQFGTEAKVAVPSLLKKLGHPDHILRGWSAWAVGEIGPGKDAIPTLIRALEEYWTCDGAITALGRIGPEARAAVPSLIRLIGADDFLRRTRVYQTLGEIGPAAREAFPALLQAWDKGRSRDAYWIGHALNKIDPEAARKAGVP